MQIWRKRPGRFGHLQLCQVDRGYTHWGIVPDSNNFRFMSNRPGTVSDKWYWRCLANALVCSPLTDSRRKGFKIPCQAPSPVYLPSLVKTPKWLYPLNVARYVLAPHRLHTVDSTQVLVACSMFEGLVKLSHMQWHTWTCGGVAHSFSTAVKWLSELKKRHQDCLMSSSQSFYGLGLWSVAHSLQCQ